MTRSNTDALQEQLATYAVELAFGDLTDAAVRAAVIRFIDTIGALAGGFDGSPCVIARTVAQSAQAERGATILGTRMQAPADAAAFANAIASRYAEMNDVYHWPGSSGGHPSDVVLPVYAVAERERASGEQLLTALVLAYEIYLRLADALKLEGFDSSAFGTLAVAIGSGKLLGLDPQSMREAISLAVVPNNPLNQARVGHLSMWKAGAAGQAGRAGVFAADLARAGMRGAVTPFSGDAGWFAYVTRQPLVLPTMGGHGHEFKVETTLLKPRASCATTISAILAAEKFGPVDPEVVDSVVVETYGPAKRGMATGEHHWNPSNRETADHSIPYVVAAALCDGTVGPAQFSEERIWDPGIRRILGRITVIEEPSFTELYEQVPVIHRTRVTVTFSDGSSESGLSGGELGDFTASMPDAEVEHKAVSALRAYMGDAETSKLLDHLWKISESGDVSMIAKDLVFE